MDLVEDDAGRRGTLVIGRPFGAPANELPGLARMARHRATDRGERFAGRHDQRAPVAGQDRAQRAIDRTRIPDQKCILAHVADLAHRPLFDVGLLAERVVEAAPQARHLDLVRRQTGRHLDQADAADAGREDIGVLGEGDGPEQRLEMEPVRHLHRGVQPAGQAKRANDVGAHEDGQAVGLHRPELIIVDNLGDRFLDRPDRALAGVHGLKLSHGLAQRILERGPVGLRRLRQRRSRHIDRHGRCPATAGQNVDLSIGLTARSRATRPMARHWRPLGYVRPEDAARPTAVRPRARSPTEIGQRGFRWIRHG